MVQLRVSLVTCKLLYLFYTIFVAAEATSTKLQQQYTTYAGPIQHEYSSTPRCGGIINVTNGEPTSLVYNHLSPVGTNERCVWIVTGPGSIVNNYQVSVLSVGYVEPSDNHMLIISCFRSYSWYENTFHVATPESSTLALNGAVLVITFVTGSDVPDVAKGFALSITSGFNMELPGGSGPHYSLDSGFGVISFLYSGRYAVSALVFNPANNNTHKEGSRTDVFFTSRKPYHIRQQCSDLLQGFRFNISSELTYKWEDMGSICVNLNPDVVTFSNSDLLLLIFRADGTNSVDEAGFNLAYSMCSA